MNQKKIKISAVIIGTSFELTFGVLVVPKRLNGAGWYNGPRWRTGGVYDEDRGGSR